MPETVTAQPQPGHPPQLPTARCTNALHHSSTDDQLSHLYLMKLTSTIVFVLGSASRSAIKAADPLRLCTATRVRVRQCAVQPAGPASASSTRRFFARPW